MPYTIIDTLSDLNHHNSNPPHTLALTLRLITGSGFADNETQLREQCAKAFAISEQVLIDQDLRGWYSILYIYYVHIYVHVHVHIYYTHNNINTIVHT